MPTKNPRVNIVVEPPLYSVLHDLATGEGISIPTMARDLIREARGNCCLYRRLRSKLSHPH
jgi:hypothetical protein